MPNPALLFYTDTRTSSDLRFFAGFEVHDPIIALRVGTKKIGILNALEYGRGKKESAFDEILALEPLIEAAKKSAPKAGRPGPAQIICELARRLRLKAFAVPADFPAGIYAALLAAGLKISVIEGPVFPQRETKTAAEARAIRDGNRCAAAGIGAAEAVLRAATIKGRRLVYEGKTLTSERVRFAIEPACLEAGGYPADAIVAGGDQGCDPHCRGSGPLRPHELIVIDVFPRISKTGYFGDMTRTLLRGTASDAQRDLVAAVAAAQKAALARVKAGVSGASVHGACNAVFAARGYETKSTPQGSVGFFHGTGHGLGLAIHEAPRVNASANRLRLGTVVTIEPGLYYPGLGGCRIEDVVQVTKAKPRMLSKYPYNWELS